MVERVLLVEDDELLGVLFELALTEAGRFVRSATKFWHKSARTH